MTTPSTPPPGWYRAPHANNEKQYWDGERWSDHASNTEKSSGGAQTKRSAKTPWIVGGVIGFIIGGAITGGLANASNNERSSVVANYAAESDSAVAESEERLDRRETLIDQRAEQLDLLQEELDEKEESLESREKQLESDEKKAEKKKASRELGGGVYVIGKDAKAGTYSTTVESGMCYYAWKSGTGSDANIVDNNIVEEGPATVTLEDGQVFESRDCGTWTRQ